MTKDRINQIIQEGKVNTTYTEVFNVLDEVSEFLKDNSDFKAFAQGQAQNGYVSPTDMFVLCYDFLHNTGKYAEYKSSKNKKETKKEVVKKETKKETDIFDLF